MSPAIKSVAPIRTERFLAAKALGPIIMTLAWLATPGNGFAQCRERPPAILPNPGFKLVIRVDKPVFEMGRPVIVYVELSNESKRPFSVTDWLFPERNYELHVRDGSGKEAPLTKWGHQIRDHVAGSTTLKVLAPGEKHADKEDLTTLYAIAFPGEFTVQVCRDIDGWGNLYSNKIKVGFVEGPPPQP